MTPTNDEGMVKRYGASVSILGRYVRFPSDRNSRFALIALVFWLITIAMVARAAEEPSRAQKPEAVNEIPLLVGNKQIAIFRSRFLGFSPEERAVQASERIQGLPPGSAAAEFGIQPAKVGDQAAVAVTINSRVLFFLTDADLRAESAENLERAGQKVAQAMQAALKSHAEQGLWPGLDKGIAHVLIATLLLLILFWLLRRVRLWTLQGLEKVAALPETYLKISAVDLHSHVIYAGRGLIRLTFAALVLFFSYVWLVYCLGQYSYTDRWGRQLGDFLISLFLEFGRGALAAIPGLITVIIIILIARWCVRFINTIFDEAHAGKISLPGIERETVRTTQTLIVAAVWLFAVVVAYPYIPGSDTDAFKGLSVLIGLMVTLGSTGLINQVISGLFVIYSRSVRPEDYVRVGDIEGEVIDVGFLATKLKTPRQEEITIPHSVLVGTATTNYSRLAGDKGMLITVSVTIGYDTPWRQVHSLLLLGASRTPGIRKEPPPRVIQRELSDFYVQYHLLAHLEDGKNRAAVLSELHANIQDAFNEYGTQIMSPHFESQPERPVFVPKSDWYAAPAASPTSVSEDNEVKRDDAKALPLTEPK
jgi:small-conductance mechanosensitive channel